MLCTQLLEVSICGSSSLKIEYGDSSDKPKLASASLFGAVAAAGTASSEQQQQPGGLASSSASTVEVSYAQFDKLAPTPAPDYLATLHAY